MPAYCFFDVLEVTDPAQMERYRSGVLKTVELYGGRYILVGGKCDIVEGQWHPAFPVLIEFPSLEQARRRRFACRQLSATPSLWRVSLTSSPLQGEDYAVIAEAIATKQPQNNRDCFANARNDNSPNFAINS